MYRGFPTPVDISLFYWSINGIKAYPYMIGLSICYAVMLLDNAATSDGVLLLIRLHRVECSANAFAISCRIDTRFMTY